MTARGRHRASRRVLLRRRGLAVLGLVLTAFAAAAAWAYWSASATAGSSGDATAASVNQGSTPTATASATIGRTVNVTWGATALSNGHAVDGYIVKRYDSSTGTQETVL